MQEKTVKKIYEDANNSNKSGYHICEEFYINIVEEEIDFEDIIANDSNHKSKLIQYYENKNLFIEYML